MTCGISGGGLRGRGPPGVGRWRLPGWDGGSCLGGVRAGLCSCLPSRLLRDDAVLRAVVYRLWSGSVSGRPAPATTWPAGAGGPLPGKAGGWGDGWAVVHPGRQALSGATGLRLCRPPGLPWAPLVGRSGIRWACAGSARSVPEPLGHGLARSGPVCLEPDMDRSRSRRGPAGDLAAPARGPPSAAVNRPGPAGHHPGAALNRPGPAGAVPTGRGALAGPAVSLPGPAGRRSGPAVSLPGPAGDRPRPVGEPGRDGTGHRPSRTVRAPPRPAAPAGYRPAPAVGGRAPPGGRPRSTGEHGRSAGEHGRSPGEHGRSAGKRGRSVGNRGRAAPGRPAESLPHPS